MKVFKKAASVTLVAALALTAAACSSGESKPSTSSTDSGGNTKAEPKEFSVFINRSLPDYPGSTRVGDMIDKETNVKLKREYLVGDLDTKIGVMIASGHYPDLMDGGPSTSKLLSASAYIPLDELVDKYAPNLKKLYNARWNKLKQPDGKVYFLPGWVPYEEGDKAPLLGTPQTGFWIQKAVLKEFNYPKIKTLDEYFDVIEKYAKKYPEIEGGKTIGFEGIMEGSRKHDLVNPSFFLAGYPNDGAGIANKVDGGFKVDTFQDKDMSKRYYQKLNEINAKKLLDQEMFIMNYDQYIAKLTSGRVLGLHDQRFQIGKAIDILDKEKPERSFVPLPLVYDSSIKEQYTPPLGMSTSAGMGISKDAKDPVAIIKYLDYLAKQDTQNLISWGVKDVDYKVNEKGRFYRTPEMIANFKNPEYKKQWGGDYFLGLPISVGYWADGNAARADNQAELLTATYNDIDKEIIKAYGISSYNDLFAKPEVRKYFPLFDIVLEKGGKAELTKQKIDDLLTSYIPKLVLSSPADYNKVWEEYTGKFKALDTKSYIDELQKSVDFRMKNW
ncbi:extracellular solute-binding protein [Paenibacillus sp. LMG 31461]|uniref:Extracellular solute-binding protein n=1 Tax=Paenibacillus plantarum TaxID=2654975 RepID=A0ABX1XLR3_9BACL|nr:extracellular solute-binding protein [Paenibacillus plantarum]NOU69374.1 extracellular solute-binding protein [Paenibacillus plantarum]